MRRRAGPHLCHPPPNSCAMPWNSTASRPPNLAPLLGTRSRVSEVLNGRRRLTLAMIRRLHHRLGIPADLLIAARPAAAA